MHDFVDIHCHMLPGIDDGAADLETALAMTQLAADDGVKTVVVTPHQLGAYSQNRGDDIRRRVTDLQREIDVAGIPLAVMPGGDVRVEDGMLAGLASGDVLTVGDHRRHVLLELPHEIYFPLDALLDALRRRGIQAILTHPERNGGLIAQPRLLTALVNSDCLMQVTAGSLVGAFGPASQQLAEWMLERGLVHFLASDAHGVQSRRPLLGRAFERAAKLTDEATALDLCCHWPGLAASGAVVPTGPRPVQRRGWRRMFLRSREV